MRRHRSATNLSPHESDEAVALIDWVVLARKQCESLRWLMRVPNGAGLSGGFAANRGRIMQAQREGLTTGAPDYLLHKRHGGFFGFALELKRVSEKAKTARGSGGVKTDQRKWIDELRRDGWCVRVCYGADEAIIALRQYVSMPLDEP